MDPTAALTEAHRPARTPAGLPPVPDGIPAAAPAPPHKAAAEATGIAPQQRRAATASPPIPRHDPLRRLLPAAALVLMACTAHADGAPSGPGAKAPTRPS